MLGQKFVKFFCWQKKLFWNYLTFNTPEKIVTLENGPENIISEKYEETPKPYQLIENVNSNISEEIFDIKYVQENVTSVKNDEIKKLLLHSWRGQNETESVTKGKKFQKNFLKNSRM